jgi:hypothetical protein
LGNNKVEAATMMHDTGYKTFCEYTVNSDTTDISPGANLKVTSG